MSSLFHEHILSSAPDSLTALIKLHTHIHTPTHTCVCIYTHTHTIVKDVESLVLSLVHLCIVFRQSGDLVWGIYPANWIPHFLYDNSYARW